MTELIQLERRKTNFINPFLEDYLYSDKLAELIDLEVSLNGIKHAMDYRQSFPSEKREVLYQVLKEQYARSGIDLNPEVKSNLEALRSSNCYTITTGQQIHVGLGPLYVWYKILTAISVAEQVKNNFSEVHVVPVFWMATEDHDLEEIQDIRIYGKEFRWNTTQTGAVGRMSSEDITEVIDAIESDLNLSEAQKSFLALARKAYTGRTLADATRLLIHEQFKELGLLVLDADDQGLKSLFKEIMVAELKGDHKEALDHSTDAVQKLGHEPQIYIRDLNLFYLGDTRERIIQKGKELFAGDKLLCATSEIENFVENEHHNISPNVALRPLYQETILPNLCYVGGPSEIKYWMQLGGLFDLCDSKLPVLVLRASWVIIPEKAYKKLNISSLEEMYQDETDLIKKYADQVQEVKNETFKHLNTVFDQISEFGKKVENNVPGFSLSGKINKIYPKLIELKELTETRFSDLALNNPEFNKIKRAQSQYFSGSEPQERTVHIPEFVEILPELKERLTFNNLDNSLEINHLVTKTI